MTKVKTLKMIGLFLLVSIICGGCASIVSKSVYPVTVNSNQPGATVVVSNKYGVEIQRSTTPATLSLPASAGFFSPAGYKFKFEKEGYSPDSMSISANVDPWYVGNIIFGGLIGLLIVDPATGAMWKLDGTIYGNLSPDPSALKRDGVKLNYPNAPLREHQPRGVYSPNTPPLMSASERLRELKKLKDEGLLTDEEYEKKRKDLVEKL